MAALTEWAGWLSAHRGSAVLAAGAALVVLLVAGVVVRRARRGRPDRWMDTAALLLTLGWSAEGMWEVTTDTLHLPLGAVVIGLLVFEAQLGSAMMRANRHQDEHGHPGQHGRWAWCVAAAMATVASLAGNSPAEVALRIAIPLLAVGQWWMGLTADGTTAELGATSWRWTPRRLLLAVGAIEPGERDAETVDRDRLIRQMTRVEYRRRHAGKRTAHRYGRQLARLSLKADDDVIAEVRRRVDRATWWQQPAELDAPTQAAAEEAVSALRAGLTRARTWVDNRRQARAGEPAHTVPGLRVDPLPEPVRGLSTEPLPAVQVGPVQPVSEPTPEPSAEPLPAVEAIPAAVAAEPAAEPVQRVNPSRRAGVKARQLTTAERVAAAHAQRPDATHEQLAELANVSVSSVKRYRPERVNGTPTPELVNAD